MIAATSRSKPMGAGFALALSLLSDPAAAGWVAGEAEIGRAHV